MIGGAAFRSSAWLHIAGFEIALHHAKPSANKSGGHHHSIPDASIFSGPAPTLDHLLVYASVRSCELHVNAIWSKPSLPAWQLRPHKAATVCKRSSRVRPLGRWTRRGIHWMRFCCPLPWTPGTSEWFDVAQETCAEDSSFDDCRVCSNSSK